MTAYHGGKQRQGRGIAKTIVETSWEICDDENWEIRGYCEPFCGMLGVYRHIPELLDLDVPHKAGDSNVSLIKMWKAFQKGWKPTKRLTSERRFKQLKRDGKSSANKGFVGHFYGYMGKYFQPFDGRNTVTKLVRVSDRMSGIAQKLSNVRFSPGSYKQFSRLRGYIIYCDPPYQSHSNYYDERGAMKQFDHEEFWDWCRKMSRYNIVFVSEYEAPKDFTRIRTRREQTAGNPKKESLYVL